MELIHPFIHFGHFYSVPSSPLLLRGAPDYSTDTVSELHAEAHRQLQVTDLLKVPTWRLKRESNPRPAIPHRAFRTERSLRTSNVLFSSWEFLSLGPALRLNSTGFLSDRPYRLVIGSRLHYAC